MKKTNDPMLKAFENRADRAIVDQVMVATCGPLKPSGPKKPRNKKDKKGKKKEKKEEHNTRRSTTVEGAQRAEEPNTR